MKACESLAQPQKRSFPKRLAHAGSVTIELSLVVPVLFFFIVAMFMSGRIIGQFAWMSQSAFQAYLIGAEFTTASERASAMDSRWTKLLSGNQTLAGGYVGPRAIEGAPVLEEISAGGTNMISARVRGGVMSPWGSEYTIPLSVSITGPILAPTTPVTDLSTPQNPPPTNLRNCVGTEGSVSGSACGVCLTSANCFCPDPLGGPPLAYQIPCPAGP